MQRFLPHCYRWLIAVLLVAFAGCSNATTAQEKVAEVQDEQTTSTPTTVTDGTTNEEKTVSLQTATFGGGCFWCVESVFLRLEGVETVTSGYMGGHIDNPTYKQICTGATGHAEVIQIQFDPEKIAFEELLAVFWATHDPTTLNRQGNDVGTQYRSAVFYHDDQQRAIAEESKEKLDASRFYRRPAVTEITPASTMFPAEDYHQDYFNQNPNDRYCNLVVPEKLDKLKKLFGSKLKAEYQQK